jgi:non-specific serine/threonine protein kinase
MPESISFGGWLRHKRRSLDLTQQALADQVGCATITLRRMEADQYKPSNELALVLFEKLGIPESERTQWVSFARGLAEYPKQEPASSTFNQPKTNLPIALTSFIGREKEVERIQERLSRHRLVTLIGVGGIGKTRLSQQVANRLIDDYANGVWLVEFAALNDPTLVPQSVATVFDIQQGANSNDPIETIIHFLSAKTLLLILDNCEHLLDACAGLADTLLKNCPNLKILATSREALGIIGEALYRVPSLTIPEGRRIETLEKLNGYESIRLFDERAQLVQMDFALTKENATSVTQICSRLDGIPLAIELAAVHIQTLSAEQMAKQLDQCFHVLTGGSRTALPKHQTLQASIDWSWQLLDHSEQTLLRRLSVFAGGFILEAVEQVCTGGPIELRQVPEVLSQLVQKSLIVQNQPSGHEERFLLLETIRQYAREKLIEAGESEQLRNRHLDFFLPWAEQAGPRLRGSEQLEWFSKIEAEYDNLRVALEWSLTQAEYGEASLRLAGALFLFWDRSASASEGRAWLARALANPGSPRAGAARAQALYADGFLAHHLSDTTAKALFEESISLWRALGPRGKTGLAYALAALGESMRWRGDPAMARSLSSEAITLFREQGERWGLADALSHLGLAIRDLGDFGLARSFINESIALWRDLGELFELGMSTRLLGMVAMRQGDYEVARRHYADYLAINKKLGKQGAVAWALLDLCEATLNLGQRVQAKSYVEESFSIFRETNQKYGIALCLYFSGLLTGLEGDNEQAATFFEQGLALAHTTGPIWYRANILMGLAGVAAAKGQAQRAARLLGAADTQLELGASYWNAAESLFIKHTIVRAEAQLGELEFAAARAEGWSMTFEQAADYALEET